VAPDGLFGHLREADWRLALETNLLGTVHCCRAAVPAMLRQGWGRIITVSSLSAVRGRPGITAYAASKGAVEAFTRALAAELAPRGVTVNALRPGWIATDMTAPLEALAGPRLRQTIPARRAGSPAEVAAAAVFLASPAASYITGAVLDIAGGL
jgi:3-oxoacyl-[acyl-carrier protein] reductase